MSGLVPHRPVWAKQASALAVELAEATMGSCAAIHHFGSTSVPGLEARPVIDLLVDIRDPDQFDRCRPVLKAIGYEWMGAFGLPGRRYLRRDDPDSCCSQAQVHGFATGSPDITRHLAFRDLLRWDRPTREAYGAAKRACMARHLDDPVAYGRCKSNLIDRLEATALSSPALSSPAPSPPDLTSPVLNGAQP